VGVKKKNIFGGPPPQPLGLLKPENPCGKNLLIKLGPPPIFSVEAPLLFGKNRPLPQRKWGYRPPLQRGLAHQRGNTRGPLEINSPGHPKKVL